MLFFGVEKWTMFVDFILIAGMSLLFLLVLFLLKSNSGSSKKLLSIFFLNAIFFLLYYYAYLHRSRILGGVALFFGSGSGFLLGPILLFYVRSLVQSSKNFTKPLLLHLSPYFFYLSLLSAPIALSMTLGVFQDYHSNYVAVADYINLIENAYFATYIFISLKLVRRIQRARRQTYSFVESSNLDWIYNLIIGLFTIVILDSIFSIYELIFPRIEWNIGTIIAVCIIVLYSILGYKGMFQSKILLPNFLLEEPSNQDSNNMNSNVSIDKNSPKLTRQLDVFSEEEIAALKLKLDEILNEKKPYLNESLSLSELAKELGITDKNYQNY